MHLLPFGDAHPHRRWIISMSIVCALLLGAFSLLLLPAGSHGTALAVGTNPTPTPPPVPTVTFSTPASGQVFTQPTNVTVAVLVTPLPGSTISSVTFYYNMEQINAALTPIGTVTTFPYQLTWAPTNLFGTVILTADVRDSAGRFAGTAASVQFVSATPTTGTSGACQVHYQRNSQWQGGFNANVTLTNVGSTTINGWGLDFTFPGDQQITHIWNGNLQQSGETEQIHNLPYNGFIPPGSSLTLGFNGTWIANDSSPTSFEMNGPTCTTV